MNLIDKIVSVFDPQSGLKREQARQALEITQKRKFDAASFAKNNTNWFRPSTTGAQEVSSAHRLLSATGQDLVRNNPLAQRIKTLWADNVIGDGVKLTVKATKNKKKRFMAEWSEWANSTNCDFEGHNNLAGLCWLWIATVVESGGVFVKFHYNRKLDTLQLQTLEQTYLDTSKSGETEDGKLLLDGIQYDSMGQIEGYWILEKTDQTPYATSKNLSKFVPKRDMIHIYRKDRAGQHLGVTWLASVATLLNNLNLLHEAKLTQQQIAACFGAIVTSGDDPMGLNNGGDEPLLDSIEPAMIEYVRQGTEITQLTPPKADNSSEFETKIERQICAGTGVTYGDLTGDYKQDSFASGRLSKQTFFQSLDRVQKLMFIPALNTIVDWFQMVTETRLNTQFGMLEKSWTFPARAMVNPQEDLQVVIDKVRAGLMTPSEACQLLGVNFERMLEQWKEDKELIDKYELKFDLDPSLFAKTGNQLDSNDAASGNQAGANEEEDRAFQMLANALGDAIKDEPIS